MLDLTLVLLSVLAGGACGSVLGWAIRADRAALEILGEYAKGWNDGYDHAKNFDEYKELQ